MTRVPTFRKQRDNTPSGCYRSSPRPGSGPAAKPSAQAFRRNRTTISCRLWTRSLRGVPLLAPAGCRRGSVMRIGRDERQAHRSAGRTKRTVPDTPGPVPDTYIVRGDQVTSGQAAVPYIYGFVVRSTLISNPPIASALNLSSKGNLRCTYCAGPRCHTGYRVPGTILSESFRFLPGRYERETDSQAAKVPRNEHPRQ